MRIVVKGRNTEVHTDLKEQAQKKLEKLSRYFENIIDAVVEFSNEKNQMTGNGKKVEITLHPSGSIIRAEERTFDFKVGLDEAVTKLERQLKKYKEKIQRISKRKVDKRLISDNVESVVEDTEIEDKEEEIPKILRTKKVSLKPMTIFEAADQMDLLGHNFFVFINAETENVNVVYRRKQEGYGLIEPGS